MALHQSEWRERKIAIHLINLLALLYLFLLQARGEPEVKSSVLQGGQGPT